MSSVDKLFKLADRFARKISLGQQFYLQPSELQKILFQAGLWDKSQEVSLFLSKAGVDSGPVDIKIQVDSMLNVSYLVSATPAGAGTKLASLLKSKYGAAMKAAIQASGKKVSEQENLVIGWLTF